MNVPDVETLFDSAMGRFWAQDIFGLRQHPLPMTCYLAACLAVREAEQEYSLEKLGYRELIDQIIEETDMVLVEGPVPPFSLQRYGRIVAGSLAHRMLLIPQVRFEDNQRKRKINQLRRQRRS